MNNPVPAAQPVPDNQAAAPLSLARRIITLAWKRLARRRGWPDFSRLRAEGTAPLKRLWILSQNHLVIRRLIDSGKDVSFISSFFRSGNTWVRCLLTDVLLQQAGVGTTTADSRLRERIIPDIYDDLLARRDRIVRDSVFVKTHEDFDVLNRGARHSARPSQRHSRFIYLYRQPEDALVSFYHYRLFRQPSFAKKTSVNAFCRAELDTWIRNVSSHLRAAEQGAAICFLSYERLLQETVTSLALLLRFLEIVPGPGVIERAVSNMEFQKLRSIEESNRQNAGEYFFRLGRPGAGIQELTEETLQCIRTATAELLKQAHDRAARDRKQLSDAPANQATLDIVEIQTRSSTSVPRAGEVRF